MPTPQPKSISPQLSHPLPPQKCRKYELLARSVLERTCGQYTEYLRSKISERRVDSNQWQLVKSRENIKIFQSRDWLQPNVFADHVGQSPNSSGPASNRWTPLSSLLCVGSIIGTLEDAMYGGATPTEKAMATRSLLIQDEFVDRRVLQDIKLPTMDQPFQYLGLKWALRASRVAKIVRARDLVYVEASGFHQIQRRGGSERVGYTVCHSVDPKELGLPANANGAVRARFSMCTIFRQKARGIVDVYVTLMSDPGGNLPRKLAVKSATSALIAVAAVIECALHKKLVWLYTSDRNRSSETERIHKSCRNCSRTETPFRLLGSCLVCQSAVCFRCVTSKKLVLGETDSDLMHQQVQVCVACVSKASRNLDATEIAMEEYVLNSSRRKTKVPRPQSWSDPDLYTASTGRSSHPSPRTSGTPALGDQDLDSLTDLDTASMSNHASCRSRDTPVLAEPGLETSTDLAVVAHPNHTRQSEGFSPAKRKDLDMRARQRENAMMDECERRRLVQQLAQLRTQAEHTYSMVREQTLERESYSRRHTIESYDLLASIEF